MKRFVSMLAIWAAVIFAFSGTVSLSAAEKKPKKKCCRVCKKGKPCGKGCIAKSKKCKKKETCACTGS